MRVSTVGAAAGLSAGTGSLVGGSIDAALIVTDAGFVTETPDAPCGRI
jgi:hypothetical protein